MNTKPIFGLMLGLTMLAGAWSASAQERAARSVHLGYQAPRVEAFYTEMTIDQTTPGSYFMAAGFDTGYMGIQDLGHGRQIALFSVWDDHKEMDRNAVPEERRAQVLYQGTNVYVGRFGGEGTGLQSKLDFTWQTGAVYRFFVTGRPASNRTEYAGYIRGPGMTNWFQMAAFSTITGGKRLGGLHSFVEDFRRNGESATKIRRARYFNQWALLQDGTWKELTRATFTADGSKSLAIDAGVTDGSFYLQNGGGTTMTSELWKPIDRPARGEAARPKDLPI